MSMAAQFRAPLVDTSEDLGFPLETPLDEMTDMERANYWRRESKKQQHRFEAALAQIRATVEEVTHI